MIITMFKPKPIKHKLILKSEKKNPNYFYFLHLIYHIRINNEVLFIHR